WPESVYGMTTPESWRFLEHAGWVAFEDIFLVLNCIYGVRELREICQKQVDLENSQDLQKDITSLLHVVATASEGDLTVRASVGAGALGSVADAFNSLVESLQGLIGQVGKQIELTGTTVSKIRASSNIVASGALTQAKEVRSATDL